MSTIVVTGGGGYIGSVLTEMLLAAGHEVRVFDRFFFGQDVVEPLADNERCTLVRGDIRRPDLAVFEGADAVVSTYLSESESLRAGAATQTQADLAVSHSDPATERARLRELATLEALARGVPRRSR